MRSSRSRHVGKSAARPTLVRGGLAGAVFAISLALVPVASDSTMKDGGRPVVARPVVAKPVPIPAQPVAGRPFAVSFKVTRSDTGAPFLRGRMTGSPSIAGRPLQHTESFNGGTARVALVVPANAAGKTLKVAVALKEGKTSVARVAAFHVQGPPSVSIGESSATEGDVGTTTMSFPVTLSAASARPVSVPYATADGTATAPSDYASTSGTLTFDPGERSKTISVAVVADTAIEQDESFSVAISGALGATIAVGTASGRITNDDTQVPIAPGTYKGLPVTIITTDFGVRR